MVLCLLPFNSPISLYVQKAIPALLMGNAAIVKPASDTPLCNILMTDLLLKSGADPSLKDKEGHAASDFDFHPDADSEVIDKEAKAEKVRDQSKNEL